MDDESLLLEQTTNRSSKNVSIYPTKGENLVKDWVEKVGSKKTAILTCKHNQSKNHFDHAISSAASAPQKCNLVLKQVFFFRNQVYQNQQPEKGNQYQQH